MKWIQISVELSVVVKIYTEVSTKDEDMKIIAARERERRVKSSASLSEFPPPASMLRSHRLLLERELFGSLLLLFLP